MATEADLIKIVPAASVDAGLINTVAAAPSASAGSEASAPRRRFEVRRPSPADECVSSTSSSTSSVPVEVTTQQHFATGTTEEALTLLRRLWESVMMPLIARQELSSSHVAEMLEKMPPVILQDPNRVEAYGVAVRRAVLRSLEPAVIADCPLRGVASLLEACESFGVDFTPHMYVLVERMDDLVPVSDGNAFGRICNAINRSDLVNTPGLRRVVARMATIMATNRPSDCPWLNVLSVFSCAVTFGALHRKESLAILAHYDRFISFRGSERRRRAVVNKGSDQSETPPPTATIAAADEPPMRLSDGDLNGLAHSMLRGVEDLWCPGKRGGIHPDAVKECTWLRDAFARMCKQQDTATFLKVIDALRRIHGGGEASPGNARSAQEEEVATVLPSNGATRDIDAVATATAARRSRLAGELCAALLS